MRCWKAPQVPGTRVTQGTHHTDRRSAGNVLTCGYSGAGDLTAFVDRVGYISTFSYENTHLLTNIVDPRGLQALRASRHQVFYLLLEKGCFTVGASGTLIRRRSCWFLRPFLRLRKCRFFIGSDYCPALSSTFSPGLKAGPPHLRGNLRLLSAKIQRESQSGHATLYREANLQTGRSIQSGQAESGWARYS